MNKLKFIFLCFFAAIIALFIWAETKIPNSFPATTVYAENSFDIAEVRRLDKQTIYFNGVITNESLLLFNKILDANTTILKINSAGGFHDSSNAMAKLVRAKNLHVVVDKICGSGCTSIFFLASKKTLSKGALLLMHHSLDGILNEEEKQLAIQGLLELNSDVRNVIALNLKINARDEYRMFFENGINIDINKKAILKIREKLDVAKSRVIYQVTSQDGNWGFQSNWLDQIKLRFKIIKFIILNKKFSIQKIDSSFQFNNLFPTKQFLIEHGVKGIEAFAYPKDQEELNAMMKIFDPSGANIAVGDFLINQ